MQIRHRLTLSFTMIVGAVLLVFCFIIYFFSAQYRKKEFESRLKNTARTKARLYFEAKEFSAEMLKKIDEYDLTNLPEEHILIFDENDVAIFNSNELHSNQLWYRGYLKKIREKGELFFSGKVSSIGGLVYRHEGRNYVVIAYAHDIYGLKNLSNLFIILLLGFVSILIATAIIGYIFAARAVAPISGVIDQVEKIKANNLSTRLETGNNKDEIASLAATFNKMLDRLQDAFEAQKGFVSNASHELRTPLTILTGQIEVALMRQRSNEEYQKILEQTLNEIKDLNQLSNDLLSLASINIDSLQSTFVPLSVDELFYVTTKNFARRFPAYKVHLELAESIQDKILDYNILGDQSLLRSAFKNLMGNACKFSSDNTVNVELSISGKCLVVKFEDKGIGIAAQDMERIFEPFFRAENAKNFKGHGIGLPLTKKIIELHGGTIKLESEIGKGSIFTVTIPLLQKSRIKKALQKISGIDS